MLRHRPAANFVGVLGWPLEHTLSPVIHSAAFRQVGLDWLYLSWAVEPDDLADAISGLRALGALGANVTMPHKETVMAHLDELSGDARTVGAVNTIQRIGRKLVGHNTDVDGFRRFLEEDAGVDPRGMRALVLGAGGAARAVVRALDGLGVAEVAVAARDAEKTSKVVALAARAQGRSVSWAGAATSAPSCDIFVNATPIGTGTGDPLPDVTWREGQVVVDLVYDPPATALVERARAGGSYAWGGLGMLVHQAAASFQIWTGQDPPLETMSAAALHAIGTLRRDH
ncbi:MAG: shikimate dehydrogenase [Actinobacteria bacterium]|nr:shikimate dehydrogenase [Actinomycetota bacterium]